MLRVGIIGSGGIARHLVDHISSSPRHELAFVLGRSLGDAIVTATELSSKMLETVDLVIEAAHPLMVEAHGAKILEKCSLMVLSCSALVDDDLRIQLTRISLNSGTSLVIPSGALVGLNSYRSNAKEWIEAEIKFVKAPENIEPRPVELAGESTIYDGTVRGIARIYPRNVNAMVAFALATVGLDACRARLISDTSAVYGLLQTSATGRDGSVISVTKQQPMVGVSGTEMGRSVTDSLESFSRNQQGMVFV